MSESAREMLVVSKKNHVTTIAMNDPRRLNGWTREMLEAIFAAIGRAKTDPETKALVLTGKGDYYSAGVNLSGTISLGHPRAIRDRIIVQNQAIFDLFLDFDKPILAAVNGHAIGAPVTSSTLRISESSCGAGFPGR